MARHRKPNWSTPPLAEGDPFESAMAARAGAVPDYVRDAVAHREVALAYQPVVQSRRPEQIAFYEGLIRVFDPAGRVIPAKDFIELTEATETGREIDTLALEMGMSTLAEVPDIRLSINMSARSIGYPRWLRALERGLAADKTVAERLILEITESSAMQVPELVTTFMSQLARQGISFALDDFGAGHTSFRYLRDFQFDILKIDGQFIRGIGQNPDNQVLVRALTMIGEQFDMFTVAEAVERAEDVAWLTENGIDCLQGYFFAAPTIHPPWADREDARAVG